MMMLTILQRSTPFGLLLPYAKLRQTFILNATSPPQCKSFVGLSALKYCYSQGTNEYGHLQALKDRLGLG